MALRFSILPALLATSLAVCQPPDAVAAGRGANVAAQPAGGERSALRVCADPANLPYASNRQPGFENRIAELLAADLHMELRYDWYRSYRSFLRNTLLAGACDVILSVPSTLPGIAVTRPYFASSFVAVTRANDVHQFTSFDDSWLKDARIGVQLVGADHSETPPTEAVTRRSLIQHISGFAMRAEGDDSSPQGRIVDAVADGKIDVAFVWGPIAGYFAKPHTGVLRITPILTDKKNDDLGFVYALSMGMRKDDTVLRDRLQGAIDRHHAEIAAILSDYGIPTVPLPEPAVPMPITVVAKQAGSPPSTH